MYSMYMWVLKMLSWYVLSDVMMVLCCRLFCIM